MASDSTSKDMPLLTETMVLDYLNQNPNFLRRHPELLEVLTPPEMQTGHNVIDFQKFALGSLQQDMQSLKDKFNGLLGSARDNMSVQYQVHQAVLQLLKARDLEHLLEVLTIDFLRYFDVDAVRLVVESDVSELYETYYGTDHHTGLGFVPIHTVDDALGDRGTLALVSDCEIDPPYAFDTIFAECSRLVRSCAMLRIYLEKIDRTGILAFGVREAGHFHAHQGVELLQFLARIVEWRLDECLKEHEIEKLL